MKKKTDKKTTKTMTYEMKSLEQWLWDAACSIRGEADAVKYKDFILPLVFVKRLCDVFDDEINRIAAKLKKNRADALKLIERDHTLVRYYIPLKPADIENQPVWSVVRNLTDKVGEKLDDIMRDIARENPRLEGIIDRAHFNATTHGVRIITDEGLIRLIEKISQKPLGLDEVEADIIGKSYEYLIRKFAEDGGQSAGEFYTPGEVGMIMAEIMEIEPGMEVYDPCCGSAGLLIKTQLAVEKNRGKKDDRSLKLYGQEAIASTWAMANMNMVIHDMEGKIELDDTMRRPKFKDGNKLKKFDRVVTNPMWNQDLFSETDYENDEYNRFIAGIPPRGTADWGWMQHVLASLKENGRAAVVLDTGAVARGSNINQVDKEKEIRKWFVEHDLIEAVLYLPDNLFYNTTAPGIVIFLNKKKPSKRKNKIFVVNAAGEFEKERPKNFIPSEKQKRIVDLFSIWEEEKGISKVVDIQEIISNDYNLSPSPYVYVKTVKILPSVPEILKELDELKDRENEYDKKVRAFVGYLFQNKKAASANGWKEYSIADVADKLRAGGTPSKKNKKFWKDGTIPFVLIEDMTRSGLFINETVEHITEEALNSSSAWVIPPGSVLLSMYATIGLTSINKIPLATNQAILAIIPKKEFDSVFLAFYLRYHADELKKQNVQSTQKNINKGIVEKFKIKAPKLEEQKKISEILIGIQGAIEDKKRTFHSTINLFEVLMNKIFGD